MLSTLSQFIHCLLVQQFQRDLGNQWKFVPFYLPLSTPWSCPKSVDTSDVSVVTCCHPPENYNALYIHKYQGENDIQLDYLSSTGPTLSLFNHGFVGSPPAGFSALGGIFQGKECWRSYNPCHMEVPLPRPKLGELRVPFLVLNFEENIYE